jgi:tetratricopeptide (TPR) repeat protein
VPQLSNEQLAEVEGLKQKLESALKENILLPPPDDYNVLFFTNRILAIDPANAQATEARNRLAEELQQKADVAYAREDWLEAEKQYRSLALIFPNDIPIGERLNDISRKIDESVKDRERRVQEWTAKADAALKNGVLLPPEKDNALEAIRNIQRLDRKSAYVQGAMAQLRDALQTRGDSKMNSGDWLGARNQFRLILQYFPDDSYSKSRLEQAEAKAGESARAEQERLEQQQEEQRSRQEVENLHRAALATFQAGDFAKALTLWQDYLKRSPQSTEAYFYQGAIFVELKQLDSAILNFERCVSLTPENGLAHLNLGILYDHHRNDPARAIEHFKKLLDLGGVDRYTPDRLRSMIQDLQDRIDLVAVEKKTFPVEHRHAFSSCRGHLRVTSQGVEYRTGETDHSFYEAWAKVRNWSVDGEEVSLRLDNNRKFNFRLLNGSDAAVVRRLLSQRGPASR